MLDQYQKEIVESSEKKIIVSSCPASGKTTVLTERVKYLLNNGADPSRVVVITFTNAAAEEMKKRIGNYSDLFIGTIHSYANQLLLRAGISTNKVLSEENFDKLFPLIEAHPEAIKPVDHLLLDEAQDSDFNQWRFILKMVNPDSYFIVGDKDQSIYGFRGGRPDIFDDISNSSDVTTYYLKRNYRNGSCILNYAERMLNKWGNEKAIPKAEKEGMVIEYEGSNEGLVKKIQADGNWGDWFILSRFNRQADMMLNLLQKNGIPCDSFKRAGLSSEELEEKMHDNTVKVLTIHVAKGLEAKNVVVMGANFNNEEERRISYVAATRAKEKLYWVKGAKKKKKKTPQIVNWE